MKIKRLLMLFASAAVLMVGCEKENVSNSANNNPVITDDDTGIEFNMSNDGSNYLQFIASYIASNGGIQTSTIEFAINKSNNFYLEHYSIIKCEIARVGNVASMSSINSIPTSGWVQQIAVNPGTGYLIRYKGDGFGYTYVRLYVKDWIVNTSGGIIGATIVYQDKWGQENSEDEIVGTKWIFHDTNEELAFTTIIDFYGEGRGRRTDNTTDLMTGEEGNSIVNFTYTYNPESKNGVINWGQFGTSNFKIEGEQLILPIDGFEMAFTKM
ncbi:MAG: hypothetical protein IJ634_01360 [Bacteroidales bacterium]|nr:hypothetical protein [Bacteroidales bacterium]